MLFTEYVVNRKGRAGEYPYTEKYGSGSLSLVGESSGTLIFELVVFVIAFDT